MRQTSTLSQQLSVTAVARAIGPQHNFRSDLNATFEALRRLRSEEAAQRLLSGDLRARVVIDDCACRRVENDDARDALNTELLANGFTVCRGIPRERSPASSEDRVVVHAMLLDISHVDI